MANKNLFYSLYSHSQEKLNPGYVCNTAVDETAVSFDIQGSDGVITDSNGSTLSTIDLSAVHAAGLTQYNTNYPYNWISKNSRKDLLEQAYNMGKNI